MLYCGVILIAIGSYLVVTDSPDSQSLMPDKDGLKRVTPVLIASLFVLTITSSYHLGFSEVAVFLSVAYLVLCLCGLEQHGFISKRKCLDKADDVASDIQTRER